MRIAAILLFISYQFLVVFGYESQEKFLPYSAVFLNLNLIILSFLVFFHMYEDTVNPEKLM